MTGSFVKLMARTATVAFLGVFMSSGAFAQDPGDVLDEKKISDLFGGLGAALQNNDEFGHSAASLGDLDGDGTADLVVGARADGDGGLKRGAVYVLFLDVDGTVEGEQKISDLAGGFGGVLDDSDEFGYSVTALGDLDGDGITDIAVGAKDDDDGGTDHGAVWILFLNANGTVKSHAKISSTAGGFTGGLGDGDEFGRAVAGLGDLDGNGSIELAVGARNDDDARPDAGAVYVLSLDMTGSVESHVKITEGQGGMVGFLANGANFGQSVAALGDIDGNGVGDLAVGAWRDNDGGRHTGAAWVLRLKADGTVLGESKISALGGGAVGPLDAGDNFGVSVAGLGDFDGDERPDLAVGAIGDDDGGLDRGAVWLCALTKTGAVAESFKLSSTESAFVGPLDDGDRLGQSVASLGDLDGDSVIKLVVGAPHDDDGGGRRGAAYVAFVQGPEQPEVFQPPTLNSFNGRPGRSTLLPRPPGAGDEAIATPVVVVPNRSGETLTIRIAQTTEGTEPGQEPQTQFIDEGPVDSGNGPSHSASGGFFGGPAADGVPEPGVPFFTDLVVANELDDTFGLLRVNVTGDGYEAHVPFTLQPQNARPVVIRTCDLNDDGFDDVVVGGARGVSVFVSDGVGSFVPTSFVATEIPVTDIAVSDIDNDGDCDAVVTTGRQVEGGESQAGFCEVLRGADDGTLVPDGRFNEDGRAKASILVSDFDGDERDDALVVSHTLDGGPLGEPNGTIELFIGDDGSDGAAGGFVPSPLFAGFAVPNADRIHPTFGAVRDFDGNGLLDAIYTSSDNVAFPAIEFSDEQPPVILTVLRNIGGTFEVTRQQTAYVGRGVDPLAEDIIPDEGDNEDSIIVFFTDNNAGLGEVAAAAQGFSSYITIFEGNGEAGFVDPAPNQQTTALGPGDGAIAEMDGDEAGALDILIPEQGSNSLTIYLGDGAGGISSQHTLFDVDLSDPSEIPAGFEGGPRFVDVGLLNDDAIPDVMVTNLWEDPEDPGAGAQMTMTVYNSYFSKVKQVRPPRAGETTLADINGDGLDDVVATQRRGAGGPDELLIYFGDSDDFVSAAAVPIAVPPGAALTGGLQAADVDGNGSIDLVTTALAVSAADGAPSVGHLLVYFNEEGTLTPALFDMSATWSSIRSLDIGDLTGDGRVDVAIGESDARLFLAKGVAPVADGDVGSFVRGTLNPGAAATGGGALRVGSLNGDDVGDVFSSNANTEGDIDQAFVRMLVGQGGGSFSVNAVGGLTANGPFGPLRPMLDDLNDDGATDMVLVHGNADSFSILINQLSRFERYGEGKPGSGDLTPTLKGRGYSTPGGEVTIEAGNALGGASGVLFLGVGRTESFFAVDTVLTLVVLPLGGDVGVAGEGGFSMSASLPNNVNFVGLEVTMQLAVLDAGAGLLPAPAGVAFSNGLSMTIVK